MVPPDALPQPTPNDVRRDHERQLSRERNRRYYARRRMQVRAERSSPEWLAKRKAYYEANREKLLARQKAILNRDKKSASDRRYREAHKAWIAERKRQEFLANRRKRLSQMSARYRADPARSLAETR